MSTRDKDLQRRLCSELEIFQFPGRAARRSIVELAIAMFEVDYGISKQKAISGRGGSRRLVLPRRERSGSPSSFAWSSLIEKT